MTFDPVLPKVDPAQAPPAEGDDLDALAALDEPAPFPRTVNGINEAIRERMADLMACYSGWLALDPDLEGELTFRVSFRDDASGAASRPVDVAIESEGGVLTGVAPCARSVLEDLRFEPGEPWVLRRPLQFRKR